MDNRILHGEPFTSHYFDPTKSIRKNKKNESHIDFYVFFSDKVAIPDVYAFYTPYSYVSEYSHTSFQSEEEAFIIEILLHQKVNDVLHNPNARIEDLYLSLLEYFCYGDDFYNLINSYPNGGFGIIALFDEAFHKPTITSFVDKEVNKERFYLQEKERKSQFFKR